jgi:3-phenylpropionate/cinnamic acid dioxygenase small subunit
MVDIKRLISSLALALGVAVAGGAAAAADDAPAFGGVASEFDPSHTDATDRADLLNLIGFYSHLADGLDTELWAEFFTEDATFSIVPYAAAGAAPARTVWQGRAAIIAAMKPRHERFRRTGVQRRHFLSNPIVWQQTATSARVAVYLQLMSTTQGAAATSVGTGRYEGRAVKTERGWRMAEWTLYSDQKMPERDQRMLDPKGE